MNYSFDKQHAILYGVDEAIMIHNFIFWIDKNRANKKHFYEGRYWTYNSVEAFKELFEFWTAKQLRRIIESLVEQKVVMRGNFNKSNMDRTGWYAFVNQDALLGINHLPKTENATAQTVTPLPYSNTDSKSVVNNTIDGVLDFVGEVRTIVPERKKKLPFKKPDLIELQNYFETLGYLQLATEFQDHYISNGWMVGKTKMQDWQAAARNWVSRHIKKIAELATAQKTTGPKSFLKKHYGNG